jgi:hypothetical protein
MRVRARVSIPIALALAGLSGAAVADEKQELEALRDEVRAEREAMAKERAELQETRQAVEDALGELKRERAARPPMPQPAGQGQAVIAEPAPEEEGKKSRLEIYGFAHMDAIHDFNRVDPNWSATLRPSKIKVHCPEDPGCGNDGETVLSVRQSRLGFAGFIPTSRGEIKTKFEFALFGVGDDEGQTTFRLRHAYGQLGPVLAGQTWSTFMDPDVYPNTVDYWGPPGMVFFRNVQLRYTPYDADGLSAALAIESPGSAVDAGKAETELIGLFGDTASSWDQWPDFTAHLRAQGDWGHVQFATLVRVLGFEVRANNGGNPDGHEIGAAGNLSGSFNLFQDDKILWQVVGGRGFAGYMNDGGVDLAPNDDIDGADAVPGIGWLLYYNRQWSERWTSSIGYGEHRQYTTGGQTGDAFDTGQLGQVNLLWHPVPNMFVGPEFIWGRLETKDQRDGMDNRVQLSFHYDFGATIGGDGE